MEVVEEVSQCHIHLITFDGDVLLLHSLELFNPPLERLDLHIGFLELTQELMGCPVGFVAFLFHFQEIITRIIQLFCELVLLGLKRSDKGNGFLKLLLKIFFGLKDFVHLFDIRLEI